MVVSTGCNSRRPGFDFQHPYCNLQPSMVPVPGESDSLLASVGIEHMWCMDIHAGKAPIHYIKVIENPNIATFL